MRLVSDDLKMVTYFGKIVNHLKKERGYTNDTLKAYSYDWRYVECPNLHFDLWKNFKSVKVQSRSIDRKENPMREKSLTISFYLCSLVLIS